MAKISKPQSDNEVFDVMQQYVKDKGFCFTVSKIKYLAEDCFLHFESKGWVGIAYWPAVAKRWVLNNLTKFGTQPVKPYKPKQPKGKSVRDTILESENNEY